MCNLVKFICTSFSDKLKKEKMQAMKESGVFTPETFSSEMAESLEKERRRLQLEVCEVSVRGNC